MSKGIITLVEDIASQQQKLVKAIAEEVSRELEVRWFRTVEEFRQFSNTPDFENVLAMIFDLANNDDEVNGAPLSVTKYIEENYTKNRVPIIVYSGYLGKFEKFSETGTLFKVEKGGEGIAFICDLLKLMLDTGFLNIFKSGGILESRHPIDLHEVFVSQFRKGELQAFLELLRKCHTTECEERVVEVFQRMALRALVNKLNSASIANGTVAAPTVNVIEHFYRRTNLAAIPVWTGDILESKADNSRVYVMRPKCDLERASLQETPDLNVLVCPIVQHSFPKGAPAGSTSKKVEEAAKKVGNAAKHNPTIGFNSRRTIPPSPIYPSGGHYPEGSAVDFANPTTFTYATLANEYNYLVTLSDDFVNEIATRFGAWLVRPGIVEIDERELEIQLGDHA